MNAASSSSDSHDDDDLQSVRLRHQSRRRRLRRRRGQPKDGNITQLGRLARIAGSHVLHVTVEPTGYVRAVTQKCESTSTHHIAVESIIANQPLIVVGAAGPALPHCSKLALFNAANIFPARLPTGAWAFSIERPHACPRD